MQVKTQDIQNQQHWCFQHIMVSFHTYLFISIHDRTLLILMLLLTNPIMPIDNINTQTIFVVLFTSRSLLTWGKPIDSSSGVSLRYLSTSYSQLTVSPFFYRHPIMTDFTFFSLGLDRWGKEMALLWGSLTICPLLQQFHIPSITPAELSSLTGLKAWGEKQNICHDITFLLILAEEEATGDSRYGLLTIWRKQLGNWPPGSSVDLIGPMPWCSYTRTPTMCHFLRRGT